MTKDEAFQQYEETLHRLSQEYNKAMEEARATLREQLKTLRDKAHTELRDIRLIEQKTKKAK